MGISMKGLELHEDAVVFDGLIVSNWTRDIFEDTRRGGLTAANPRSGDNDP